MTVAVDECGGAVHVGNHIALFPWQPVQQRVEVEPLGVGDVEGYPVPSLFEVEGLYILVIRLESYRYIRADNGAALEGNSITYRVVIRRHGEHHLASRGILPEFEIEVVAGNAVVIDRKVEIALAGLRRVVNIGKAVALALSVESTYDVAVVNIYLAAYKHTPDDIH